MKNRIRLLGIIRSSAYAERNGFNAAIRRLGIIALAAVIGFTMTACDTFNAIFGDDDTAKGYTFEFEIVNNNIFGAAYYGGGKIVEVRFLNGDNPSAPVIQTETVDLSSGESATFKVSGFTEKGFYGFDGTKAFAISYTYADGTRGGGTEEAKNGIKINVKCYNQTIFCTGSGNNSLNGLYNINCR